MKPETAGVPYEDGFHMHRHKCDNCGTVWEHRDAIFCLPRYHQCPTCGGDQYYRYHGPLPPQFKMIDIAGALSPRPPTPDVQP